MGEHQRARKRTYFHCTLTYLIYSVGI